MGLENFWECLLIYFEIRTIKNVAGFFCRSVYMLNKERRNATKSNVSYCVYFQKCFGIIIFEKNTKCLSRELKRVHVSFYCGFNGIHN